MMIDLGEFRGKLLEKKRDHLLKKKARKRPSSVRREVIRKNIKKRLKKGRSSIMRGNFRQGVG